MIEVEVSLTPLVGTLYCCSGGHLARVPAFRRHAGHHRHHTQRARSSDGRRKCEPRDAASFFFFFFVFR